ncbi:uncharacterized protein LOC114361160 [Ostrinia furnacalis]|uniref:uncharacterized protein LOC114361160 n=1 Tax=Ostrinia furnacalis TaxID=93504 RepID=UPI001038A090|nr:uncharacterized protein LOC114361160 [Ostrinia furnacalis]
MVKLSGSNLPKRQHELNIQVNETVSKNVPFKEIEAETETSDADRLFKIDVAAKYKNTEFIIETLKSGDSLYISRVLKKCCWLYDDEFATIMNTDYLHYNIFPFMSLKMKKHLLTALYMNMRNENRAADFYRYCKKIKLDALGYKFLKFTSESFKLELMQENISEIERNDTEYWKMFIGNSFTLFEEYLRSSCWNKNDAFEKFSYLYSVSDVQYLDLLEKHVDESKNRFTLSLKITKHIAIKHKNRIMAKPDLYVNILNVGKLLRHSSLNEVEFFAIFLLPAKVSEFWSNRHQIKFRQIINVVPENERYAFAKKIFADKYHNEEFEMCKEFYVEKYYSLMTLDEREAWAMRHIASGNEIFGSGRNFIWYKFVNFTKAFDEIKKLIQTTTDKTKRSDLLKVLVQSATNNVEVEKLLQYYYERHVNENKTNKTMFLLNITSHHNVFKFEDRCWTAFTKICNSMKAFDADGGNPDFKIVAMLFNIINDKEMPDVLVHFMELSMPIYSIKKHIENIDKETKLKVYDYIFNFYLNRIIKFQPGSKDDKLVTCLHFLLELMALFEKTRADIPDNIIEFTKQDKDSYRYQQILQRSDKELTESDLIKCLKEDSKLAIDKLPEIKQAINESWTYKTNNLLKKLKVYFSEDVGQTFLKFYTDLLSESVEKNQRRGIHSAVYGIFQLSDEKHKIRFMEENAPENAKIDHEHIDAGLLKKQEAICRYVSYSRPLVPLANILKYIKGDYVHYCLPMFNRLFMNLPNPTCLKFVESLINSPVSTQKHGLRLAFKCFSAENLKKLLLNAWKSTKNVSIRSVIYKNIFEKTANDPEKELYDILKFLTLDLNDTDDDDLFSLYRTYKLSAEFVGEFYDALWTAVKVFIDTEQNVTRKTNIIKQIDDKIYYMKKDTVKGIVMEYLNSMFNQCEANTANVQKFQYLYLAKWELLAHYIEYFTKDETDLSVSIEMTKLIVTEILKRWNDVACDIYVYRRMLKEFVYNLDTPRFVPIPNTCALLSDTTSFVNALPVFEAILTTLETSLPLHEIYCFQWKLRIIITTRRVIKEVQVNPDTNGVEMVEKASGEFGRQIGNLVKEAVNNAKYFAHFVSHLAVYINSNARNIQMHLRLNGVEVADHDILVLTARGLLELNTNETSLLALEILPLDPKCNLSFYQSVYKTLKEKPELEIQCCMSSKFSDDCKRRRYE